MTAMHRSGRTFPVELTVIPIRIDGTYIFYSFVRDITDRKLARSLGGDIVVKKTMLGQGSIFLVTIKNEIKKSLANVSKINLPTKNKNHFSANFLENQTILVVDDAADNRHLIGRYLVKKGAHVDFADNGLDGVEKAMMGHAKWKLA